MTPDVQVVLEVGSAEKVIKGMAARMANFEPVFRGPIDKSVTVFFVRQFATEGRAFSGGWAPLRPLTKLMRQRRGHGRGGIGRDTNRMWASLVKSGGPEGIRAIGRHHYQRGTTVPHAASFHTGVAQGKKKVFGRLARRGQPPRPLVPDPMPLEVVKTWERTLLAYATKGTL